MEVKTKRKLKESGLDSGGNGPGRRNVKRMYAIEARLIAMMTSKVEAASRRLPFLPGRLFARGVDCAFTTVMVRLADRTDQRACTLSRGV